MSRTRLYLFDTTLRDGAQTQGVDFSVSDKTAIAEALDALGVAYVEGGWPGANPTDDGFFKDPPALERIILRCLAKQPAQRSQSAGARLDVPVTEHFGLNGQVQYSRNDSNLSRFDYDNFQVTSGPTVRF